ncbi:MAG: aromatic amino acid lyase [Nitrospinae bacterium]|nr:aromatic amino acid lyase [Nitrospinota bacterium]
MPFDSEFKKSEILELGTRRITPDIVNRVAQGEMAVKLSSRLRELMFRTHKILEKKVSSGMPIYGINLGVGYLSEMPVAGNQVDAFQERLILSHAVGVGEELSCEECRAIIFQSANSLSLGTSGVRPEVVNFLLELLNRDITPCVPSFGSVGSSGDLVPLAHIALSFLKKGYMIKEGKKRQTDEVLKEADLYPPTLLHKEGLALINGTHAMAGIGALEVERFSYLCNVADLVAACSMEALGVSTLPFNQAVMNFRPHPGQCRVAKNLIRFLKGSKAVNSSDRHQDAFSLRCTPQVHGAVRDTLDYAQSVLTVELNSCTDNPAIDPISGEIYTTGNFHGEPLAFVFDYLAIAAAELGSLSERRINNLLSGYASHLPLFLTPHPDSNTGYMIIQYTAVSLLGEMKVLARPASTDSFSLSLGKEDHVSMGWGAIRKLKRSLNNLEMVLALELLCAIQGINLRYPIKLGLHTDLVCRAVKGLILPVGVDSYHGDELKAVNSFLKNRNAIRELL